MGPSIMLPRVLRIVRPVSCPGSSSLARLALAIAFAASLGPWHAPHVRAATPARPTLTVRGRVTDDRDQPLVKAWVYSKGSRRVSTLTDAKGEYTLAIPAARLDELAHQPLLLRIQSHMTGWRVLRVDGAEELAVELSVTAAKGEAPRLRVRSNDARVAEAMAGAAVLDGSPLVTLEVDFRASRGVQGGDRPAALTATQEVTLSGVTLPGRPESTGRAARSGKDDAGAAKPRETRTEAPLAPDGGAADAPGVSASDAAREREEPREAKEAEAQRRAAEKQAEEQRRREAKQAEKQRRAEAKAAAEAAREAERNEKRRKSDRGDAPPRVYNPADAPAEPVPAGELFFNPAAPPKGEPPARPVPVVVRPAKKDPPPVFGCACRIDGFIEIQSDQRVQERLKLRVFVEGQRDLGDDVELFMGSPRSFTIKAVPCGLVRLVFDSGPARQQYRLQATTTIACKDGGHHQARLVLEPAKRKPQSP
jgi:hypothetical protein